MYQFSVLKLPKDAVHGPTAPCSWDGTIMLLVASSLCCRSHVRVLRYTPLRKKKLLLLALEQRRADSVRANLSLGYFAFLPGSYVKGRTEFKNTLNLNVALGGESRSSGTMAAPLRTYSAPGATRIGCSFALLRSEQRTVRGWRNRPK